MRPTTTTVEQWTGEVATEIQRRLAEGEVRLQPLRIEVHEQTDPLGEDAWRLVLVLPAPHGDTWDPAEVFEARRAAIDVFDELAAASGHGLPGSTIARVTTDDAAEEDLAPEDEPEEGEDPGRRP